MKWPRHTPVFYKDGKFRCRVSRQERGELLAQLPGYPPQADAECWKCHAATEDSHCVEENGHDWILVLRPASFQRSGAGLVTENEVVANVGGFGAMPRASVKRKMEHLFGR